MSKKIIYITGCLGFIGQYVTRLLLESGHYIRGIDKVTYAANIKLLEEFNNYHNFVFERIDICDIKWLYDCDYIINLAAETHVDNSIVKSDDFVHSNINGVHNLLELIRKNNHFKMPVLIHFSTDEVYGDIVDGAHKECHLLKPSNPYSATKASGDMLIKAWERTYDVPAIIVRPTNNYGIGQYVEKLIPKACKFLSIGRRVPMHENGEPIRNWLHAKDTAKAIEIIINKGKIGEIYNISGNFEQKNIITFEKIIDIYYKGQIKNAKNFADFDMKRKGQDVRYAIDDSKIKALGWKPECNFDDELPEIIKYYKDNFMW